MTLSDHVRILGRGPGRSRSLTRQEARDAMQLMLSGKAAPEAVGALLMLLRMKGETAEEIAGFAEAAVQAAPALPPVDLDWPSYAAGRTRGQPWFLLSAKLVARHGHRVLIHGWNGSDQKVREGLAQAGIGLAQTPDEATRLLERDKIAYLPLENMHPALFRLLTLRDVLGLRSCINTVCRMLNPGQARTSVQGVFHPSYRLLQTDAAALLGWSALCVIKGGGGEFERHPSKDIVAFGLRDGAAWQETWTALCTETRRLAAHQNLRVSNLWQGPTSPEFEAQTVLGTASLALRTLGITESDARAQALWTDRHRADAA
ncbi:glycosyl transferase family protein [Seohaeicola saemankumensis]|uniref:glycosyl transferase family protein n=1 Tax=Seohaeicola saemankumensis TaxID=481181 RepID=UPI001E601B32|nr:glycosyl transferase family protein [Seohaeicola saemankumensis]MCD1627701.1 glycosyl transferase family protein [Seohaeicola saemankumensis]